MDSADTGGYRHIYRFFHESAAAGRNRRGCSDEWNDEDDEVYLSDHDRMDGKIVSFGLGIILGIRTDHADILQYSFKISKKKIEGRSKKEKSKKIKNSFV